MMSPFKKINYVVSCLLLGVLLTSADCGGGMSKQDKDSKEKRQQLLEFSKKEGMDQLVELLEKIDDPSVSIASFKEILKQKEEQFEKRQDKKSGKRPSYKEGENYEEGNQRRESYEEEGNQGAEPQSMQERFIKRIKAVLGEDATAIAALSAVKNKQQMQGFFQAFSDQYPQLKELQSQIGEYFRG